MVGRVGEEDTIQRIMDRFKVHLNNCTEDSPASTFFVGHKDDDEDWKVTIQYDANDIDLPVFIRLISGNEDASEWIDRDNFKKIATYMNEVLEHMNENN